jgi:hypothetical protein
MLESLAGILTAASTRLLKRPALVPMFNALVSQLARRFQLSSRSYSVEVDVVDLCRTSVRSELHMRQPATQVEYTGARRNPGFAQALLSLSRSSATKQYIFGAGYITRYPDMTLPSCIAA